MSTRSSPACSAKNSRRLNFSIRHSRESGNPPDSSGSSRVFVRFCRILRFTQKPEGPKKSEIPAFAGTTRACLAPHASDAPFTQTGNARKPRLLTEARAAEEQRSGISSHDHLGRSEEHT